MVFTTLARKAASLADRQVLGGWLCRATHFAARDVVRAERRRRMREQEAQSMHESSSDSGAEIDWEKLHPHPRGVFGEAQPRAEALLGEVGLGDRVSHRPGMLSGGEQQRVAVARALLMKPALLLADEPTGDLDEQTAAELHVLLRRMHSAHGLTSLIATHNMQLAESCDRVLRLEAGRLRPV